MELSCSIAMTHRALPRLNYPNSSTAIKKSINQSNLLAVVAIDAKFNLYINGQHIDSISDNTFQGYIGLRASYYSSVVEVVYSNIKVWTL